MNSAIICSKSDLKNSKGDTIARFSFFRRDPLPTLLFPPPSQLPFHYTKENTQHWSAASKKEATHSLFHFILLYFSRCSFFIIFTIFISSNHHLYYTCHIFMWNWIKWQSENRARVPYKCDSKTWIKVHALAHGKKDFPSFFIRWCARWVVVVVVVFFVECFYFYFRFVITTEAAPKKRRIIYCTYMWKMKMKIKTKAQKKWNKSIEKEIEQYKG